MLCMIILFGDATYYKILVLLYNETHAFGDEKKDIFSGVSLGMYPVATDWQLNPSIDFILKMLIFTFSH